MKIGIIGLGAIGQRLIGSFSDLAETKIEIAAVCDTAPDIAKNTGEKLNAASYTDHRQMLEEVDFDLVYVAVPPKYHARVAADVMEKGIHILCEKPLANSLEEAEFMLQLAKEKGIIHAMNFPLNYNAPSRTYEKLIKEGYIGKLRRLELTLRFPKWPRPWQQNAWVAGKEQGGFVLEVGIHYIQQIQKIFGAVEVVTNKIEFPQNPQACEEAILASLVFEDGTPLLFDGMSGIAGDERLSFTAYGTEGTLSLINWAEIEGAKIGAPVLPIEADSSLSLSLADEIVKAVSGEKAHIIDFQAGYEAQKILEQLRNG